jgi:hypothetical protein
MSKGSATTVDSMDLIRMKDTAGFGSGVFAFVPAPRRVAFLPALTLGRAVNKLNAAIFISL